MNGKKAKQLRRLAKQLSEQIPQDTQYQKRVSAVRLSGKLDEDGNHIKTPRYTISMKPCFRKLYQSLKRGYKFSGRMRLA